jgi:hypothetical protein
MVYYEWHNRIFLGDVKVPLLFGHFGGMESIVKPAWKGRFFVWGKGFVQGRRSNEIDAGQYTLGRGVRRSAGNKTIKLIKQEKR